MLSFDVEWLDPPPPELAAGPERETWAELCIRINGDPITRHHSADARAREEANGVIGGMAPLADWIVDNFLYVLWETQRPFPTMSVDSSGPIGVPSLRDADQAWLSYQGCDLDELARWQHRHSFGHADSPLALPSIVLVPDERRVGVALDYAPARIDPTVRFTFPAAGAAEGNQPQSSVRAGPANLEPIWLPKDEVRTALEALVSVILERARTGCPEWVTWLERRFSEVRRASDDDEKRRSLMLGEFVAEKWDGLSTKLGSRIEMLRGLLLDVRRVTDLESLETLTQLLPNGTDGNNSAPDVFTAALETDLLAHQQGQSLAIQARKRLGIPSEPLWDLAEPLKNLGAGSIEGVNANGLLRSAIVRTQGVARIFHDTSQTGVAPTRFAICAAFGRLLAEARSDRPYGSAHGCQSRLEQTRRANAFAAEFLLPKAALDRHDDADPKHLARQLADQYGISWTAAMWQIHNRKRAYHGTS